MLLLFTGNLKFQGPIPQNDPHAVHSPNQDTVTVYHPSASYRWFISWSRAHTFTCLGNSYIHEAIPIYMTLTGLHISSGWHTADFQHYHPHIFSCVYSSHNIFGTVKSAVSLPSSRSNLNNLYTQIGEASPEHFPLQYTHKYRKSKMCYDCENNFEDSLYHVGAVIAHVQSTEHEYSPAHVQDNQNIRTKCCITDKMRAHM